MKIKTSQEIYQELLEKGKPTEDILKVMINRADRYQNYFKAVQDRVKVYKKQYADLLRSTGRLITVSVDHMARENWGSYVWYKNKRYRYECDGIWKRCKNNQSPHHSALHIHGKFKVNILLSEEDMPEVFIGKCSGSVFGEKVITAKGHMICYGDEFELRKIK